MRTRKTPNMATANLITGEISCGIRYKILAITKHNTPATAALFTLTKRFRNMYKKMEVARRVPSIKIYETML
jgi:hypothetical protein